MHFAIPTALVFASVTLMTLSLGQVWDRISSHYVATLRKQFHQLGIPDKKLNGYMRLWGFALLACVVLFGVLMRNIPMTVCLTGILYFAPKLVLESIIKKRKRLLRDQMVGATQGLANTTRAGLSLAQGLETVVKETPLPLSKELGRIVADYNRGRPLIDAIREIKDRLDLESFTLFSSAISVSLERGGRISETLDRIYLSLQEIQRLERKMESETASGKLVLYILAAAPFGFLAFFFIADPETTKDFFDSIIGQIIMCVVILMVALALRMGQKIMATDY